MAASCVDVMNCAKQLRLLPAAVVVVVNAFAVAADDVDDDNSWHPNAVAVVNMDRHRRCDFDLQVVLNSTKSSKQKTKGKYETQSKHT